jgi:hypothetical protein
MILISKKSNRPAQVIMISVSVELIRKTRSPEDLLLRNRCSPGEDATAGGAKFGDGMRQLPVASAVEIVGRVTLSERKSLSPANATLAVATAAGSVTTDLLPVLRRKYISWARSCGESTVARYQSSAATSCLPSLAPAEGEKVKSVGDYTHVTMFGISASKSIFYYSLLLPSTVYSLFSRHSLFCTFSYHARVVLYDRSTLHCRHWSHSALTRSLRDL